MQTKENTLKIRIDGPTLELIERASQYISLDKSKFIRLSVREKAREVLSQHETTLFGPDDWQTFFDMLDMPQAPSDRMQKARQKYDKIVSADDI